MIRNKLKYISIFIVTLMFVPILSGCVGSGSASEKETVTFNFGSMDGPPHVQNAVTFPAFIEEVERLTDGRVDFRMYMGGTLGGPNETLDNIVTGLMDVGRGIHGYNAGKFPAQSVLNLPFLAEGTGEELSIIAQKLYDKFPEIQDEYWDVKPLWIHASDPYAIVTKNKAVRSFEDVKGMRLRTPSQEGSEMLEAWGATPVSMGAPAIYDAIQKGVIDGGVLPIAAIKDFNLTDVVDYVTIGYFNTNLFYVSMNENSWEEFTPQEQEMLEEVVLGIPMAQKSGQAFDDQKEKAEKEARAAGVEFIELPEEELNKFKEASKGVSENWIAKMEAEGIDGQQIYDEAVRLIEELNE